MPPGAAQPTKKKGRQNVSVAVEADDDGPPPSRAARVDDDSDEHDGDDLLDVEPRAPRPARKKPRKGVSISVEADNEDSGRMAVETEFSGTGHRTDVPVPALITRRPRLDPAAEPARATASEEPQESTSRVPDEQVPAPGQEAPQAKSSKGRSRWKASTSGVGVELQLTSMLQAISVLMAEFQSRQPEILDYLLANEYDPRCLDVCGCGSLATR
ncbi:hypothetical protein AURDEDRAFT_176427 [Auricularia subglabra TFB-10046 SS5]|uniref:Uncharacterized protein n=1 Tax=Auricularia subglabra (strain TFB-10046 / SS5) TaxID=717982 RepID=J0CVT1_AURST|nr:hypothetical protein AURDEDRAFT_176427 [Auricularia subglabra TFB-10046 SS5]